MSERNDDTGFGLLLVRWSPTIIVVGVMIYMAVGRHEGGQSVDSIAWDVVSGVFGWALVNWFILYFVVDKGKRDRAEAMRYREYRDKHGYGDAPRPVQVHVIRDDTRSNDY